MGCAASTKSTSEFCNGQNPARTQIPNWDEEADRLRGAVNDLGIDEVCIVSMLARFTNKQRQKVLKVYKERFNEDLATVLELRLSEAAQEVVSALLCPPITYNVHSLNKAFEDQDYDTIVTIIVSSKSITFLDTVERYHTEYKKTIKDELLNLPDKDLSHILVSLIDVDRPSTNKRAEKAAAKERAKMLYNNGDILSLLCEPHSRNQLKETFAAFLLLYRVNINQFIEENSSALSTFARETLKGCVIHIENPPLYFAKKIKDANETQILRMIVSRSETDLYYINKEFLRLYARQLHDAIQKQCSSKYAELLTAVLELRGQYSESAKKR